MEREGRLLLGALSNGSREVVRGKGEIVDRKLDVRVLCTCMQRGFQSTAVNRPSTLSQAEPPNHREQEHPYKATPARSKKKTSNHTSSIMPGVEQQ